MPQCYDSSVLGGHSERGFGSLTHFGNGPRLRAGQERNAKIDLGRTPLIGWARAFGAVAPEPQYGRKLPLGASAAQQRGRSGAKRIAAGLALLAAAVAGLSAASPPSIVLVLIDDLGWYDLGCQGGAFFETPRIDSLAAGGVRFTDAYSNCPVCSPSRAALMSGQYPGRVGFTGHITAIGRHRYPEGSAIIPPDDRMSLAQGVVTLAEALSAEGYATASIGKWHLGAEGSLPRSHGFDVNIAGHQHGSPAGYFHPYRNAAQAWNPDMPNLDLTVGKEGDYLTDRLTDEAVRFIEASAGRPFFLYLSHYAVHTPLEAPARIVAKYEAKLRRLGPGPDPVYAAMVETVDRSVGRVLRALDAERIGDDTVVIVTSDNGGLSTVTDNGPLREGKGHLYEGGIRVPLIVRWPGRGEPGTLVREPVTLADLYPFVRELAGSPIGQYGPLDGRSLAPLFEGDRWQSRDLVWYYPHYSPQAKAPGAALRHGRYKLIEHYDPPAVELYDLEADVGESRDLADRQPGLTGRLRARLTAWIESNVAIRHTPNPAAARSVPQ